MIVDTNSVASYSSFHTREIHAAVRTLSPERKLELLDKIQLQKAMHDLTEQEYNHDDYKRIEKLLKKS